MSLQDEITRKSGEIYREAYQMSIGELINLYWQTNLYVNGKIELLNK